MTVTQIVERRTELHNGLAITLVRDTGDFWGWIVGKEIQLPMFRHFSICRDDALRHIDGRQR